MTVDTKKNKMQTGTAMMDIEMEQRIAFMFVGPAITGREQLQTTREHVNQINMPLPNVLADIVRAYITPTHSFSLFFSGKQWIHVNCETTTIDIEWKDANNKTTTIRTAGKPSLTSRLKYIFTGLIELSGFVKGRDEVFMMNWDGIDSECYALGSSPSSICAFDINDICFATKRFKERAVPCRYFKHTRDLRWTKEKLISMLSLIQGCTIEKKEFKRY